MSSRIHPTRLTRRFLLATLLLAPLFPVAAAPRMMSFDEVQRGQVGEGRTVFQGTAVETFQVEILGKLRDVAPGRSLILARLSGGPLERTGVMAGMSGSPVFIDDRLIGAVAYSWGFSREPIAGITPIAEMWAVATRGTDDPARGPSAADWSPETVRRLEQPATWAPWLRSRWHRLTGGPGPAPLDVPLSIGGLDAGAVRRALGDVSAGWLPMQGSSGGATTAATPPLVPGSAIGVELVRGDVSLSATGTATWVEGDTVIGFGHPLFGLGSVDLPLTAASVEALLPSLAQSAKLASTRATVGALVQDRSAGIAGRSGRDAAMIPVDVRFLGTSGDADRWSFEIVDDPALSPVLLYLALTGLVGERERAAGPATVRLGADSRIHLADGRTVRADNLFTGEQAVSFGTTFPAYLLYLLMNNPWASAQIAGVRLEVEFDDLPRAARIRHVTADRSTVRPGEELTLRITLEPFAAPPVTLTQRLQLPGRIDTDSLTLHVGGPVEARRFTRRSALPSPRDLDDLIARINGLRANDRVFVTANAADIGGVLDGVRLEQLPPHAAAILTGGGPGGPFSLLRERRLLTTAVDAGFAVEGEAGVTVEVESP